MADKENSRKCLKCGCSPAENNIKLFRFPKPAIRNLHRCELWAKYIFPDRNYSATTLQMKLHNEHRMLCQKHFNDADFTDESKTKLLRSAVPYDCEPELPLAISYGVEPQAGPSHAFREITNEQNLPVLTTEPIVVTSKVHSKGEKTDRERMLYAKCCKYLKTICKLRNRIKNLKSKEVLKAVSDEMAVKKLSAKTTPAFALLLQGQLRNCKKKITGRRWNKEEKITALRMFKRSPTCYRLLRRLFHLPSPTTLQTLLSKVPFPVGINKPVIELIKKYIMVQKPSNNVFTLMFDEMSLKKHLHYNPKDDVIEGFQDHASQGRSPLIAAYALVFMITGIRQKVKQPIAHYFSSGFCTADRLAVLLKEVLHQCLEAGINIVAMVCDMDGANRRALNILGASVQHPYIVFENKEIVTLFDPPHLLKCFRNLFMKYNIECSPDISSNDVIGTGVAKWSHIKEFYEVDSTNANFVYAPMLKNDHLNPNTKQKMKVKLAAQVLSSSVSGGMYAKIATGELTSEAVVTANIIKRMDNLFDAVNSDSPDLRRGKPHATNLRSNTPHLKCFNDMKNFFLNMKYIGCIRKPPSQEGWIWTLNAMERLWHNLENSNKIASLATRRIQQDALENLFGCIRSNCGCNTNPTCGQFLAGLKTAVLSNLTYISLTGNCEDDNYEIINNFSSMIKSAAQPTRICAEPKFNFIFELPQEIEEAINNDTAEIQACAYVCGFLLKKMMTTCEICKDLFISKSIEKHHLFVEFREYSEIKKSLNYVTKEMVSVVECCATYNNKFLEENGYRNSIKKYVTDQMKCSMNFDFLNKCPEHKILNINNIINSVFAICTKRFCILQNRKFAEEASAAGLKHKMNIIMHK